MQKKYYWIEVKYISGKHYWLWCSPKLTCALNLEKSLNPYHYRDTLIGNYLVVPYRDYSKNGIEHLTLAKVIKIQRSNKRTYSWHQTRSQFLTQNNIGTKLGFNYIKHDYHLVTRLHLFITSCLWRIKYNSKDKQTNKYRYQQQCKRLKTKYLS